MLRAEFASDRYDTSRIASVPQDEPGNLPKKYCQVLGERHIIDGEITQRTVSPNVRQRFLPSGLDVAATVFGSERAKQHLQPEFAYHPDLKHQIETLRAEFGPGGERASLADGTIYDRWLRMLSLLDAPPHEDAPAFMQSDAWRDKQLNAALASWAWLRHDFVLYAKETMVPACAPPQSLVEPVPEFYAAAETLARQLATKGFPGTKALADLCDDLELLSQAALGETDWLDRKRVEDASRAAMGFAGWLDIHLRSHVAWEDPTGVVDVCSDTNTHRVLHVATGPLHPMIVEVEGRNGVARRLGYVMSYHEWAEPDWRRLTDSEWRDTIRAGDHHDRRPEWTESFMVR